MLATSIGGSLQAPCELHAGARIFLQFIFENFRLLRGALPIAGLCRFGQPRQFEMGVGIARRIQSVLEPRPAGDALGIAPVALDLDKSSVHAIGGRVVSRRRRDSLPRCSGSVARPAIRIRSTRLRTSIILMCSLTWLPHRARRRIAGCCFHRIRNRREVLRRLRAGAPARPRAASSKRGNDIPDRRNDSSNNNRHTANDKRRKVRRIEGRQSECRESSGRQCGRSRYRCACPPIPNRRRAFLVVELILARRFPFVVERLAGRCGQCPADVHENRRQRRDGVP